MNKLSTRKRNLLSSFFALLFVLTSLLLPNYATAEAKKATVGIYITKIFDTDLHTNQYATTFWLWVLYPPFDNWNPENNLDFLNAKQIDKITSTADKLKDGRTWWQGKYRVAAISNWNVENYPFDVQDVYLSIEDNLLEASQLQFIADSKNSGVANDAISQDWKLVNFDIKSQAVFTPTTFGNPEENSGSDFSRVIVHVKLKRENGWGKFLEIFIPCYISLVLSFATTLIPIDNLTVRINLTIGAIFSAVGGHYALHNILPYSRHFTLSDKIELQVFIYLCLTLITTLICGYLHINKFPKATYLLNKAVLILSIIGLPLCNYLLLRNIV